MPSDSMKQLYASIGVFCLHYATGHLFGVLTLMLPTLREPESELQLTLDQESWITSTIMLMATLSQIAAGILSDVYGRKVVMCLSMLPLILSSVLMYSATTFAHLLIAATAMGITGAGIAVGQIYVAEAVSPKRRGATLALNVALTAFGLCLTMALRNLLHWRTLILFNAMPGLVGFITSVTSPESPMWFASKGRFDECRSAFFWLRGKVNEEEVWHFIMKQKEDELINSRMDQGQLINNLKIVLKKNFVKSTLICTAAILCVEVSGKHVHLANVEEIMVSIDHDNKGRASYHASGAILADLIALSMSCFVLRILKRRTVLFTTGFLALILLMVFSTLEYLRSKAVVGEEYNFVILLCYLSYNFFINIGVMPVATAVQRELYPVFHRGLGIAMCGIINGLVLFGFLKVLPSWLAAYGMPGTFVLRGLVLLMALSYLFNFLPETGGCTLQDIETKLRDDAPYADQKPFDIKLKMVYLPCHPNARESY